MSFDIKINILENMEDIGNTGTCYRAKSLYINNYELESSTFGRNIQYRRRSKIPGEAGYLSSRIIAQAAFWVSEDVYLLSLVRIGRFVRLSL